MTLDYKLARNDEAFGRVWEKCLEESLLMSFTVLRPRYDVDLPGLIYWDTKKRFVTEIDFEEDVKAIEFERSSSIEKFGLPPRHLIWSVKSGNGYELGLTVPTEWWERLRVSGEVGELARTEAHTNHLTGETQLMVATLPLSKFDMYYQPLESDAKRRLKQEELRDGELVKCGWKREERYPYAEVGDPWECLKHKYFSIQHRSI